jgi:hypothetical protein
VPAAFGRRFFLNGLAAGTGLAAMGAPAFAATLHAVSHAWAPWNAEPPDRPPSAASAPAWRGGSSTPRAVGGHGDPAWQRCLNDLRTAGANWMERGANPDRNLTAIPNRLAVVESGVRPRRLTRRVVGEWSDMAGMTLVGDARLMFRHRPEQCGPLLARRRDRRGKFLIAC